MQLLRPKKWTQKPPLGTKINFNHPLAKGLQQMWMFREGAGASVFDSSGNTNTGTLPSGVTWAAGRNGKAISLSGASTQVKMGTNLPSSTTIPNNVTISAWTKPGTGIQSFGTIAERTYTSVHTSPYHVYKIGANYSGSGKFSAELGTKGLTPTNINALANYTLGVWYLVTLTYDGTTMRLYVNGIQQTTSTAESGNLSYGSNGFVSIGSNASAGENYVGSIDDVRIYNRALNGYEINSLYTDPYGIFVPQSPVYRNWFSTVAAGIAFDAAANSGYQAAQSTYTFNRTCTGSNRYLVVDVSLLSAGQTVSSIVDDSGGGNVQMTFIGARSTVSSVGRIETWGLVAPATGTKSIQVNLSGTIASAATAVSYTGVHQSLPYEAFSSNQATNVGAADATVVVTPIADNTWIHAAIATDDGSITANQTTRNNVTGAGGSGANEDSGPITPAAATTMSYTNVGALQTWAIAGVALRPIAASGPISGNFSTNQFFQLLGLGT